MSTTPEPKARDTVTNRDWHCYAYALNSALLFTHEIDSAFWREWELLRLPGGLPGFLASNLGLILLVQVGFVAVVRRQRGWRLCAVALAMGGLVAALVHGALLAAGGLEFRAPASLSILGAGLAVSVAQVVLVIRTQSRAG